VIGGWFVTALGAFITALVVGLLLCYGEGYAFVGILLLLVVSLDISNKAHHLYEKAKQEAAASDLSKEDIVTIQVLRRESPEQISKVIGQLSGIYTKIINGLNKEDLASLKSTRKKKKKMEKEIDRLKGNMYYFIRNLDETSVEASKFYVHSLGYLQDTLQSLSFIVQSSTSHVDNNHKKLKFNQIKDIKTIDYKLDELLTAVSKLFEKQEFQQIQQAQEKQELLVADVEASIQKQIRRIRTTETSPKNSKLYFSLLLETNDLIAAVRKFLELFKEFDSYPTKNN